MNYEFVILRPLHRPPLVVRAELWEEILSRLEHAHRCCPKCNRELMEFQRERRKRKSL
jgi:hypothetical protein